MNKNEAEKLLNESRKKIDVLDKKILDLIIERTSLSYDIISSKQVLEMDLYDDKREQLIHNRLKNLVEDINIDQELVLEIFELLRTLSKKEQQKYLD